MKLVLLLLSLTMSVMVSAKTYFVAPNGRDSNPGTKEQPWGTWGKAFSTVIAGDSVYFRGGVYYSTAGKNGYSITKSGTVTDTICFLNYPGEVPVLDCDDQPLNSSAFSIGITVKQSSYVKLRGLTVRNVLQYDGDDEATGLAIQNTNHVVIENCTVYNTGGKGFMSYQDDELYLINCDSYNNCDSLTSVPINNPLPGNDGYGYQVINWVDNTDVVYFRDCRAWLNGDDGFSMSSDGRIEIDGCWSFRNGLYQGAGNGFKLGWISNISSMVNQINRNCVSAFNRYKGWTTNDQDYAAGMYNIYNCTAYHNGYQDWHNPPHGFYIERTDDSDEAAETARRIFKNNLAYDNEKAEAYAMSGAGWTHTYNSWDVPSGVTITDADFISVDSTGITAARQADGSLPDNNCYKYFLKLAEGSALIDAGTDVGLKYNGSAPDLGAFESSTNASTLKLVNNIGITAAGSTAVITINKGTLQLYASISPSDATTKTVTWSVANGTGQANISSSGLVTAISGGTVTAKAIANDGSGVYGTLVITISNQEGVANQPPLVTLSSPTKSTSYTSPATITIDAVASDPDGIITKVEFYQGTIKLGERTVAPYSFTWKEVTAGTYAIYAVATDNKNTKATSATVNVVVEKAAALINQIPVVSIVSPGNNKKIKKNEKIVIEAVASDPDGIVSKVEFKSGNITIAEMTSPPYLLTWEAADTGKYIITAVATDNLGATSRSANIDLTVDFNDVNSENINLYPNPNSGHFTIKLLSALPPQDHSVSVVNLTGQMVYKELMTQEENIKEIDISNSLSGTYILVVSTGENVVMAKKFIKN